MGRIDSLCASNRRNLRMEVLNRAEGDVMTMLAGMNEELADEDVKEELMRSFFDTSTTIQVIEKLRGMKQKPGENARLYAARYKVIHFRVNQLMAEEQSQSGEMMFYAGILQDHLSRKLLKKIYSSYRPSGICGKPLTWHWILRRNTRSPSHGLTLQLWKPAMKTLQQRMFSQQNVMSWPNFRLLTKLSFYLVKYNTKLKSILILIVLTSNW